MIEDKTYDWSFSQAGTWEWTGHVQGVGGVHLWVQARRSYCDRGHWEWGYDIDGFLPSLGQKPSYYFMSIDRARQEIERWLMSGQAATPDTSSLNDKDQPFSTPHSSGLWSQKSPNTWEALWPEEPLGAATLVFDDDPIDPTWVLDVKAPDLDHSDQFPRRYRDAATARSEAEEFIRWRWKTIRAADPDGMTASWRHNMEQNGFDDPSLRHPISSILCAHVDAGVLPPSHVYSASRRPW